MLIIPYPYCNMLPILCYIHDYFWVKRSDPFHLVQRQTLKQHNSNIKCCVVPQGSALRRSLLTRYFGSQKCLLSEFGSGTSPSGGFVKPASGGKESSRNVWRWGRQHEPPRCQGPTEQRADGSSVTRVATATAKQCTSSFIWYIM